MLSQIGYKELELFGPYPFSSEKDNTSWKSITTMVGFTQSGYFNHSAKQFKEILDLHGLRTPAMHVGLDTLRNKLGETVKPHTYWDSNTQALQPSQRKKDAPSMITNAWLMNLMLLGEKQNRWALSFTITIMDMA